MILERDVFVQFQAINGVKYLAKDNQVYELDEIGELVWESIDGKTSLNDIANRIASKYNVNCETVLSDISEFAKELLTHQLVEEVTSE